MVDAMGVHIRVYKNRFFSRPASVNFASLELGSFNDNDSLSVGHMPLTHRGFAKWAPVYITDSIVTADELEGGSRMGVCPRRLFHLLMI